MKRWIYLSPHFDDVVLSAGGMVWEQARQGDIVEVWTICAGDPPADKPLADYAVLMHTLWELGDEAPYARSLEDAACCRVLGVSAYRRYTIPDNIYRYDPKSGAPLVQAPDDNFGPLEEDDAHLLLPVADFLRKNVPPGWEVVSPLAVGNHRDHRLTRRAAEKLGFPLWHYVDYPYAIQSEFRLEAWVLPEAERYSLPVSPEGVRAWGDGFACHRSQLHMFWGYEEEMRQSLEAYLKAGGGNTLYRF
jgi:LmbE family N-acetylglucosaminyl deacetylase